jgi:hypothetical protein
MALRPHVAVGLLVLGDQRCTESATTIPYDEFAGKSEGADYFRDAAFEAEAHGNQIPTSLALRADKYAHLYS